MPGFSTPKHLVYVRSHHGFVVASSNKRSNPLQNGQFKFPRKVMFFATNVKGLTTYFTFLLLLAQIKGQTHFKMVSLSSQEK
jgi:hypothetical protein